MPDLNLLVTLRALVEEGSVARAGERLRLSPSAMSRALARLREVTGDPLLVRAGRGLVPTPRALELRERIGALVDDAESVLRPARTLDLRTLERMFRLRTSDGFVENFGPALVARVAGDAPGVQLRFLPKASKDSTPLRDGTVDLETAVVGRTMGPELRTQGLFRDQIIGVVRAGHPLGAGTVTPERYAAARHVVVSRRGRDRGPIDRMLEPLGLERHVATTVGHYSAALALARASDLVASVPERLTRNMRDGMFCFPLPAPPPAITIALVWHPRLDADPAHRWLRACIRDLCADPPADA